MPALDEFEAIARLFRPLTRGAPEAAELLDDAAFLPARPGFDLVITADAVVEGVHFPPETPPELAARKLLRVNLSDLAAKAAEPFGYFLTVAWPAGWEAAARAGFARGLAIDGELFGLRLLGGDTVSTSGPLAAGVTMLGHAPAGRAVRRSGARPGDAVMVTGTIGDGWLGLEAATGRLKIGDGLEAPPRARYELPEPRLGLRALLLEYATACLDVSDGLIADLGHLATASGVAIALELDRVPLSEGGRTWLSGQGEAGAALATLAAGGDDYELVFTVRAEAAEAVVAGAAELGLVCSAIGRASTGGGVVVRHAGERLEPVRTGWRHP